MPSGRALRTPERLALRMSFRPATGLMTRLKRTEHPAYRHILLRGRGLAHEAVKGHCVRRLTIRRYLRSAPAPALQIGAGPIRLDGWLNSDLIAGDIHLDLERRLPLPDGCLAYVFGEHVIGTLSQRDGVALFAELHRVLRPRGVLRLTTPDLAKLIAIYRDENPMVPPGAYGGFLGELTGKSHQTACQVLNDALRLWGARHTYDEEDLTRKLEAAGFDAVERVEPDESRHAALRGLERHREGWVNQAEALCVEATRG